MDKLEKALKKLSEKDRQRIKTALGSIIKQQTKHLDLKKLKGRDDIYRVRVGQIRIIYRTEGKKIFIMKIERRSDTTYQL